MGNNWSTYVLDDVIDIIGGGTPKRSEKEYWGGQIPWLSVKDFNSPSRYVSVTEESITDLGLAKSSTKILSEGQLIISARGTVGELAQLKKPMAFNQSCYGIDAKRELATNDFLYYLLTQQVRHLRSIAHGSVFDTITRDTFKNIEVSLPEIKDQIAITNILGSLDDKIELNRQMNETLEAMAQALFKSWFLDFDPVIDNALAAGNEIPEPLQARAAARKALGDQRKPLPPEIQAQFPSSFVFTDEMGWIPEGWEVVELSAVTTELRRGISPKYTETGGVRVVNQKCIRNHLIDFSLTRRNDPALRKIDGREICVGDVLVNSTGVGTLGRMAQVLNLDEVTVVDSHVTVVRADPKAFKPSVFGLMMLNLEPTVEAMGEGSTGQTELSRANLQAMKVVQPSPHLQESLEQILESFAARQVVISNENDVLSRTRDTLLPKLLSGELRVKNAEPKVAETL